eukprot:3484383-Prymnesium_polylepis.2
MLLTPPAIETHETLSGSSIVYDSVYEIDSPSVPALNSTTLPRPDGSKRSSTLTCRASTASSAWWRARGWRLRRDWTRFAALDLPH